MKIKKFNKDSYNTLNHLSFNRNFHVRQDLMDKMNLYGFTVPINIIKTDVIDGKMKLYIADGQNRALTAVFLGIEFYGTIIDRKFKDVPEIVEYVSSLNSTSRAWKSLNYVEAYNHLNIPDYQVLLKLKNSCPYSVETLATILAGNTARGSVASRVKNGRFKINALSETISAVDLAARLSKYEKLSSRMLLALSGTMSLKRFNEEKFIAAYKKNAKDVKDMRLDDYSYIFNSWV
jgi:hypothetical protein